MPDDVRDAAASTLAEKIRRLQGPILVLGASGFVGANLMRSLFAVRDDVYGTTTRKPAWRLEDLPDDHVRTGRPADRFEPRCPARRRPAAHRSSTASPTAPIRSRPTASSSTRPTSSSSPGCCRGWSRGRSPATSMPAVRRSTATTPPARRERDPTAPNSDYAVSKVAAANLIYYLRQAQAVPLRQSSALLGLRPARRLVAADPQPDPPRPRGQLSRVRQPGHLPRFRLRRRRDRGVRRHRPEPDARPTTASRSTSAPAARPPSARSPPTARELFGIAAEPSFTMPERRWDVQDWYANIDKARERLGWQPRTCFRDGLERDRRLVSRPARQGELPPVVQEIRPRHRLQRQRDRRLLQGQPGDPDHVRAAQGDVHQAEHRLRDHLRQRLQPRRYRGGHPRASRGTTGG